ncbi:MAG: hypothetical protein EA398_14665 [Deltaproteobacteria bacterium]|nr:MAG: hypothetical protein EA398_14665 [Deltaproteobacteria bacterium]
MTAFGTFEAERICLKRGRPGAFCVEASAGTGKTYSITGLVLRLVCEEDVPLDEILVVTFTRAAAAELRGRIGERLGAAERDLERAEGLAKDAPELWSGFLAGAEEAVEEVAERRVFSDDFVERWVRAALAGQPSEGARGCIPEWLERIRRARQRVDAATFTTIHSFCQRMLEWHAFESDQPLGIAFAEDEEGLREEIANDLWGELVETVPDAVLRDAQLDPDGLGAAVRAALSNRSAVLRELAGGHAAPWRGEGEARAGGGTRSDLSEAVEDCGARLDAAHSALRTFFTERRESLVAWVRALAGHAKKGNWMSGFSDLTSLDSGALREELEAFLVPRLERAAEADMLAERFWMEAVRYFGTDVLAGGLAMRGAAAEARSAELLAHPLREALGELARALPAAGEAGSTITLAACREARRRYAARLAERSEVTFDDLITRLANRVEAEHGQPEKPLTTAVRERFKAALIDEFQDTDDAQWTLFEKVFLESEAHRLFLIGDPKQAIYRFRSADIHTYLRARTKVHEVAVRRLSRSGSPTEEPRRAGLYTMARNFRSDGALIVALNRFMGALHAEGKVLDEAAPAVPVPAALEAEVAFSAAPGTPVRGFFDRGDDTEGTGIDYILVDWQKPTPRDGEDCVLDKAPPTSLVTEASSGAGRGPWTAQPLVFRPVVAPLPDAEQHGVLDDNDACKRALQRAVAEDIRRLLESGTRLKQRGDSGAELVERPVTPGDIAVIVQAWKMGHAIAAQLRRHGIPTVIMAGEVVWTCDEAEDLAVVLQALLNLRRQETVVAALATPLLSVSPDHLRAFTSAESSLPERWLETLGGLARTWETHGLLRMLTELLDLRVDGGSGRPVRQGDEAPTRREALLRVSDGERRLTNLLQLAELLHAECSGLFLGPQGQLDTLRARMVGSIGDASSPDDPRKQRLDTDDRAVRITTVHGSKGLEYPIVFLPGFDAKGVERHQFTAPVVVPEAAGTGGGEPDDATALPPAAVSDAAPPSSGPPDGSAGQGPRPAILYATRAILDAANAEHPPPRERDGYEAEEESRRLLYVALTRAMHQVVLYVRDWSQTSMADLAEGTSPYGRTALGRLLGATPRVREQAGAAQAMERERKEGIAKLKRTLSGARRAKNPRTSPAELEQQIRTLEQGARPPLVGDLCLALGEAVNPLGASVFDVPLEASATAGPPERPWVARPGADSAELFDCPPEVPREHFHAADYRQGSFSSLAKGAAHGTAQHGATASDAHGTDHAAGLPGGDEADLHGLGEFMRDRAGTDEPLAEVLDDPEEAETSAATAEPVDLLFEKARIVGRDFGTAIHELLEKVDFAAPVTGRPMEVASDAAAAPGSLHDATAHVVRRFGFRLDGAAVHGLATDVHTFLHAPLGGALAGTSLADIPRQQRIDELEFLLPVPARLTRRGLLEAFRTGPPPGEDTSWAHLPGGWKTWLAEVERLTFDEFHGFLTGFVDLVFATSTEPGRLHLLDYKTNKLHTRERTPAQRAQAYGQPALVQAMIESRYVLQYHLYQVALYRLLRTRLGSAFDWNTHMGGAWYPFLRGVQSAEAAAVVGEALRRGIFHDRPPRERIEALDALFGTPHVHAGTHPTAELHAGGTP